MGFIDFRQAEGLFHLVTPFSVPRGAEITQFTFNARASIQENPWDLLVSHWPGWSRTIGRTVYMTLTHNMCSVKELVPQLYLFISSKTQFNAWLIRFLLCCQCLPNTQRKRERESRKGKDCLRWIFSAITHACAEMKKMD